ncbi:Putative E3 ubiquitin-protein ligase [Sarcoptes scabiei]|uniref:RING-type E3 ubiquitin transferase n=1 Tax=Sarcoptes scabiei TaxID=52283 RepID=A0A131ZSS9_SARSC|nr:Putative E3 ubiquitin-protein ligase [Sarcoptes scabiei]KPL96864.1 E3 ubiquitin-protein ligase Arkadia-like protein [Sarcoptes scabiei]
MSVFRDPYLTNSRIRNNPDGARLANLIVRGRRENQLRNYFLAYYRNRNVNANASVAVNSQNTSNSNNFNAPRIRSPPSTEMMQTNEIPVDNNNPQSTPETTTSIEPIHIYYRTSNSIQIMPEYLQSIEDSASPVELNFINVHSGLSKQEINRHTISYKYKPRQRKRITKSRSLKISSEPIVSNNESTNNTGDVCCICLERFNSSITVRRLPCLHLFHCKCIDKWLNKNRKCPICRIMVTINYDDLFTSLNSGKTMEQSINQQYRSSFLSQQSPESMLIPLFNHHLLHHIRFHRFQDRSTSVNPITTTSTSTNTTHSVIDLEADVDSSLENQELNVSIEHNQE